MFVLCGGRSTEEGVGCATEREEEVKVGEEVVKAEAREDDGGEEKTGDRGRGSVALVAAGEKAIWIRLL